MFKYKEITEEEERTHKRSILSFGKVNFCNIIIISLLGNTKQVIYEQYKQCVPMVRKSEMALTIALKN